MDKSLLTIAATTCLIKNQMNELRFISHQLRKKELVEVKA